MQPEDVDGSVLVDLNGVFHNVVFISSPGEDNSWDYTVVENTHELDAPENSGARTFKGVVTIPENSDVHLFVGTILLDVARKLAEQDREVREIGES